MKFWRVIVSRAGAEWTYVLSSRNARATSVHWRALGASVRVRREVLRG